MDNNRITQISGRGLPLRGDDIDTDRIIPARFMKETTFQNMGKYAFHDSRFSKDGSAKKHAFNDEKFKGASVLIVNRNFGCGSSREHAPQALMRFGIRAVVGESFAEIFAGNCQLLGVPCVTANPDEIMALQSYLERENPSQIINLNLEERILSYGGSSVPIQIAEPRRRNLLKGSWDTLGLLTSTLPKTREKAQKLPYIQGFD